MSAGFHVAYDEGEPLLVTLAQALRQARPLTKAEAAAAARALAADNVGLEWKRDFLEEFSKHGETAEQIVAFAEVFRGLARNPHVEPWAARALDVCGTGGDHSGSFNISTTVAFIVAAAGVPVFKHGNRSITSKCGSADFLEANGILLDAPDAVWHEALAELNFAFFFAPSYHPAFRNVAPVRRVLGRRTIFNVLGPLLNPGRPAHQIIGVSTYEAPRLVPVTDLSGPVQPYLPEYARAAHELGMHKGLIVHGRFSKNTGLDELSVVGSNCLVGVGEWWEDGREHEISAADLGLAAAPPEALKGGDAADNLRLLDDLLQGSAPAGLADTICLNAGAALLAAGRVSGAFPRAGLQAGVAAARALLTGGAVREWLQKARSFFARHRN